MVDTDGAWQVVRVSPDGAQMPLKNIGVVSFSDALLALARITYNAVRDRWIVSCAEGDTFGIATAPNPDLLPPTHDLETTVWTIQRVRDHD